MTMGPIGLMSLLLIGGIVLLIGEFLLPTHGVLGVAGALCIGGVVIVCFTINQWLGLSVFLALIVASPLLLNLSMKLWAASPVGRKMILGNVEVAKAPPIVKLGQVGRSVTELRPMGECDFGDIRVEAISELGIIEPGRDVKVISLDNGRPTVRVIESTSASSPSGRGLG